MNRDKIKNYILELLLVIILFFALFASNIFNRTVLSILLVVYMVVTIFCLKKRTILSIYNKQVTFIMFIFAVIYLGAFYLIGIYSGFTEASVKLTMWSFYKYIIPLSLIIISSEVIRSIFLAQKVRYAKAITFVSMVLIDVIIYAGIYDVTTISGLLTIVGFILFASISCNLLYNYISIRFGIKSIIIYRLLTTLYVYFIPIIPDVYVFFRSLLRMLYPYLIYLVLESTYAKSNFAVAYKDKRKGIIGITFMVVIMTLIIMLISCQFRYGILVIGSGSMTGAVDKGDAVVFESYRGQNIREGQVIIFEKGNDRVVHRVIEIKDVNGEVRYFTKGDANQNADDGYITEKEIFGITMFRIRFIGYPTILVKEIFS